MTRPKRPSKTAARPGKPAKTDRPTSVKSADKPRRSGPRFTPVQLKAPPPDAVFRDRDGRPHSFPESSLKRVAAAILTERRKPWRYRPFSFPLFTDKGNEQAFQFDFYVYDNMDQILRLVLVVGRDNAEIWDKVGRFKRQFPMYHYELWTPEKLAELQGPRGRLGF
ncbi:hypothetical protein [Deinococcus yavapaiensis]|uniref:Uncharacterized protein n=1 Tax=Deinococcus yavapaiensis KR-236 TaxID=694435 RepID=A0A318SGL8_9DEIO|nr:hypothetical protein [Deinococcus yavapaiensis]PYE56255.1 hypothetical protein DES52_10159 [Deinococcus yavapaiensis KR-236]